MVELFLTGVLFVAVGGTWIACHRIDEWRRNR